MPDPNVNPCQEILGYTVDALAQLRSVIAFQTPTDLHRHLNVPVVICELALEELADRLNHAWLPDAAGWRIR